MLFLSEGTATREFLLATMADLLLEATARSRSIERLAEAVRSGWLLGLRAAERPRELGSRSSDSTGAAGDLRPTQRETRLFPIQRRIERRDLRSETRRTLQVFALKRIRTRRSAIRNQIRERRPFRIERARVGSRFLFRLADRSTLFSAATTTRDRTVSRIFVAILFSGFEATAARQLERWPAMVDERTTTDRDLREILFPWRSDLATRLRTAGSVLKVVREDSRTRNQTLLLRGGVLATAVLLDSVVLAGWTLFSTTIRIERRVSRTLRATLRSGLRAGIMRRADLRRDRSLFRLVGRSEGGRREFLL